jgi:hypothetical protein
MMTASTNITAMTTVKAVLTGDEIRRMSSNLWKSTVMERFLLARRGGSQSHP